MRRYEFLMVRAFSAVLVMAISFGACVSEPPPPELIRVEPGEIIAGERTTITVHGRNFHPVVRGNLSDPEEGTLRAEFTLTVQGSAYMGELTNVTFLNPEQLRATVPAEVPVGPYALEVVDPRGRTASLLGALDVEPAGSGCVPSGLETCNGLDDDCDGATDEAGAIGCTVYYVDSDGDGYGDSDQSECLCAAGAPYVAQTADDCSDADVDNWSSCETCVDTDGDGSYAGCDGYATNYSGPDCNDAASTCQSDCITDLDSDGLADCLDACVDVDADGFGGGVSGCSGTSCDSGGGCMGPDCSDRDRNNWAACVTCTDTDGDGWYAGCDEYVTLQGPDCDDDPMRCGNLCSGSLQESVDMGNCADGWDNDCDGISDQMEPECVQGFDVDPGWASFNLPLGANDIAWSATSNAGGDVGEIRGTFQRQVAGAYYADTSITTVSSTEPFTLSGRVSMTREDGNYNQSVVVGYFNAPQAEVGNSFMCGMLVREGQGEGPRFGGVVFSSETANITLPALSVPRVWSFDYDPNMGAFGEITFTISGPGGRSETVALVAEDRLRLDRVTAFGLYKPGSGTGTDPGVMEMFVDDLSYAP